MVAVTVPWVKSSVYVGIQWVESAVEQAFSQFYSFLFTELGFSWISQQSQLFTLQHVRMAVKGKVIVPLGNSWALDQPESSWDTTPVLFWLWLTTPYFFFYFSSLTLSNYLVSVLFLIKCNGVWKECAFVRMPSHAHVHSCFCCSPVCDCPG